MIKIYGRSFCKSCQKLKDRLNALDVHYESWEIDKDVSREWFVNHYPGVLHLPVLIVDGIVYEGLEQSLQIVETMGSNLGKELLNE